MEMHLTRQLTKYDVLTEIKTLALRTVLHLPGAVRVHTILRSSFLKLLFIPVLFALSTYAADYTDVQSLRAVLDPVVRKLPGVEGSIIGACVRGTDRDPFKESNRGQNSIDMCLVYFVKNEASIPRVRKAYQKLGINSTVAVRFQKI